MSNWTIPQPGLNSAELEKPVLVFQPGVDINSVYAEMQAQLQARQVHTAVALGWSLSELLGRCFLLQDEPTQAETWDGAQLIALPEVNSPRESVRALMEHILFLAGGLNVGEILINSEVAPSPNAKYAGVLREQVIKLCSGHLDTARGETYQSVLGDINERLYFWDLKIHDALQNYPMVVYKAYLVGQSLAALRWYFNSERSALNQDILNKICHEYIPLLGPYLPPFATGALSNSVAVWGKAAITNQVMQDNTPYAPDELHKQAHIWYDMLTGARNPLSYVDTTTHGTRYIWRVVRVAWPLFLLHFLALFLILVVFIIALVVIVANLGPIFKEITALAGLLALVGASHFALNNVVGVAEKALVHTGGAIKGSLIDATWHATQQEAVNGATCIMPTPPASPAGQITAKSA
jgi:hypothetical protein